MSGATDPEIEGVELVRRAALEVTASDFLAASHRTIGMQLLALPAVTTPHLKRGWRDHIKRVVDAAPASSREQIATIFASTSNDQCRQRYRSK